MKEGHFIPPKIRVKNWKLVTSNDFYNQYINYKNGRSIVIGFKRHVRLKSGFYNMWCITLFYDDKDGHSVIRNKYVDFKVDAKEYAKKWMKKHILK